MTKQSDDRPEWVHCIRHTHVELKGKTWCGRAWTGWDFKDADHAAENGRQQGRLVACRECVAAVSAALINGHDDAEYRAAHEPSDTLSPLEKLFIEWWCEHHDNTVFFNSAVRTSEKFSAAVSAALNRPSEKSAAKQYDDVTPDPDPLF